MDTPQTKHELRDLLLQVSAGTATDQQQDWLREALATDLRMRWFYWETMAIEAALPVLLEPEFGAPRQAAAPLIDLDPIVSAAPDSVIPVPDGDSGGSRFAQAIHWQTHPFRFWTLSAMLTVAFVASLLSLVASWQAGPLEPRRTAEAASSKRTVGQIAAVAGARWNDSEGPTYVGAFLRPGQRLDLAAGLAQIAYDSGAQVVLQGPAVFEVLDRNGGRLGLGTLVARVHGAEAKGFVVQTPQATIVDLGTEFGVEVDEATDAQVQVFEGRIDLTHATTTYQFKAGEGAVVRNGKVTAHENDRTAFASLIEYQPSKTIITTHQDIGESDRRIVAFAEDFQAGFSPGRIGGQQGWNGRAGKGLLVQTDSAGNTRLGGVRGDQWGTLEGGFVIPSDARRVRLRYGLHIRSGRMSEVRLMSPAGAIVGFGTQHGKAGYQVRTDRDAASGPRRVHFAGGTDGNRLDSAYAEYTFTIEIAVAEGTATFFAQRRGQPSSSQIGGPIPLGLTGEQRNPAAWNALWFRTADASAWFDDIEVSYSPAAFSPALPTDSTGTTRFSQPWELDT